MKLNNSKYIRQDNFNRNQKNIDCFWEDCIIEEPIINNISNKKSKIESKYNNGHTNHNFKKINYSHKIYEPHKSVIINNCYNKLSKKFPNLYKEEQSNISKKLKIKNSLKRSLLLYSYGLEVQKAKKTNISQNKIHKEQEELKLCTWKPKLNNYKKIKKNKISNKKDNNNDYKTNNNYEKKIIDIDTKNECTFRPKLNKNSSLKKIFNRKKSLLLYTDRENSSFILRYKKARDEYMIKRLKRLSEKDDSYDSCFLELTSRKIEEPYKSYLNVNNNNIQIYNNNIVTKQKYKNRIFNLSASNNNLSNSNSNNVIILDKNINKSKKYYVGLLKKQLRFIDLEI